MKLAETARNLALIGAIMTGGCDLNTSEDPGTDGSAPEAGLQTNAKETPVEIRNFDDERKKLALKFCDFDTDGNPEPGVKRFRGSKIVCADLNGDGHIDIVSASGAGKDWCTSLPKGDYLDPRGKECAEASGWTFGENAAK